MYTARVEGMRSMREYMTGWVIDGASPPLWRRGGGGGGWCGGGGGGGGGGAR